MRGGQGGGAKERVKIVLDGGRRLLAACDMVTADGRSSSNLRGEGHRGSCDTSIEGAVLYGALEVLAGKVAGGGNIRAVDV